MADIFNMLDTWNAGATVFTGIKLSVTDTASAAGSLLMDLQVGGESRFKVGKQLVTVNNGAALINVPAGNSDAGITIAATNAGGGARLTFSDGLQLGNQGTYDVILRRDAANTLAQRNGVNAQAFNLYNTYTDASNYERGFMRFVSNTLRIGAEALGTGTVREVEIARGANVIATTQASGFYVTSGGRLGALGRGSIFFTNTGGARLLNIAEDGFDSLQLGGATSSFPAIKRSTTSLQARLADDSAFTNIQGKLTTDTAYTAGAPTATGYIVLFDSTGTAYRVPAVAN